MSPATRNTLFFSNHFVELIPCTNFHQNRNPSLKTCTSADASLCTSAAVTGCSRPGMPACQCSGRRRPDSSSVRGAACSRPGHGSPSDLTDAHAPAQRRMSHFRIVSERVSTTQRGRSVNITGCCRSVFSLHSLNLSRPRMVPFSISKTLRIQLNGQSMGKNIGRSEGDLIKFSGAS